MELQDIVEAASKFIPTSKGTLILHRSIREHPKFKVYKTYCYHLYIVKIGKKKRLLTVENIVNSHSGKMLEDWKEMDKLFLVQFIGWLSSDSYNELKDEIQ